MLIADSQVHVWSLGTPVNSPWQRQIPAYTKDDLLADMDAAGVDRAVIVPPMFEGQRNEIALTAARGKPDRLAVMGSIPFDEAQSQARIATWREQPGMLGLRLTFAKPEERQMLEHGGLEWLWEAAEGAGLPLMIAASSFLPLLGEIAARHSALKVSIDHLGRSRGTDDSAFADLPELLALAKYANVTVKASCLPAYTSEPYPYPGLHQYIRQVYDAFGAQRMFWGSDQTRLTPNATYKQCVTLFTEELPWLPEHDKELIMGSALCRWLDWPV